MIDTKFINQSNKFNQNSPGLNKDESMKTKNLNKTFLKKEASYMTMNQARKQL